MDFLDSVNTFYIGQDFRGSFGAQARIDNFRLSNKALTATVVAGQQRDVDFSSNLDCVYPVIENAYTTMLLDFDQITEKITDFAILRDPEFGLFNFALYIIDSFDIVLDSAQVKSILESLIYALKPATSKVEINYVR